MSFVHLHCHTEFSLLDGCIRPAALARKAKEHGMSAAAITDHGNMFGVIPFYKACKKEGIKPIIGCEIYTTEDMSRKEPGSSIFHLVLLARTMEGYKNMMKIVSAAHLEGKYYKPRADRSLLRKYGRGLIALSACLGGEIPQAILGSKSDLARRVALEYAEIFDGNFYLELQENGIAEQRVVNAHLQIMGREMGLGLVATNDCHYLDASDQKVHELMLKIQTHTAGQKEGFSFASQALYFKTPEEMRKAFVGYEPSVLDNTLKIAEMCDVELEFGKHHFPVFDIPAGESAEIILDDMARSGLEKRFVEALPPGLDQQLYKSRLEHELRLIHQTGFSQYFLIVQDFINWAKSHGIPVGPGRGSAAGSLVAYALRITNIDPIPYHLIFERFINPERVSLPDIDVDFCEARRELVIEYMSRKYGQNRVAQIATMGTMQAKSAIRDVVRAMSCRVARAEEIIRCLPDGMSIRQAMDEAPELKDFLREKEQQPDGDILQRQVLDYASQLEGMIRQVSTHAAGLVCSPTDLTDFVPLMLDKNGKVIAQYDMHGVEAIGLVKVDFLGLRTLTVIDMALTNIRRMGQTPPDMDKLPMDDQEVFALYGRGEMLGVFQMESGGMRKYLKMLKPEAFEDIIAMCALFRPGPLGSGMADTFIRRKQGKEHVDYFGLDDLLEPILRATYGVIVYQEQVMQIAQAVAGYTLGNADLLRRAMGKKKPEEMAAQREVFLQGARANGVPTDKAVLLFDMMEKFAEYGFNKSHSAAYAFISYQTAYLKTHFRTAFLAAVLSSEIGRREKLSQYIFELKAEGVRFERPDILLSRREFTPVEEGVIRFGLGGIKSVGDSAVDQILEWQGKIKRGAIPEPRSIVHCLMNLQVSSTVLEGLIKSGAFDGFERNRNLVFGNIGAIQAMVKKVLAGQEKDRGNLLGGEDVCLPPCILRNSLGMLFASENSQMGKNYGARHLAILLPPWDTITNLTHEREFVGFYVSGGHPMETARSALRKIFPDIVPISKLSSFREGDSVRVGAYIAAVEKKTSRKSGNAYFTCRLEDDSGWLEGLCFASALNRESGYRLWKGAGERTPIRELLVPGKILVMEGRLKVEEEFAVSEDGGARDNEYIRKLFIHDAVFIPMEEEEVKKEGGIRIIELSASVWSEVAEQTLESLLLEFPGDIPVVVRLNYSDGGIRDIVEPPMLSIDDNDRFEKALAEWKLHVATQSASRPLTLGGSISDSGDIVCKP